MIKRVLLGLGLVAGLLVLAAPAGADDYPPAPQEEPGPAVTSPTVSPPVQASPTPRGALPRTGDDSSLPLARAGVVLVAAGGLVVLAARRRRASFA